MNKIDIHCHTTNRKIAELPSGDASINAVAEQMEKYEIEKTILLATYFPFKGTGISNYRLFDWIRNKPQFNMFASLDFEHYFYQGINELEEITLYPNVKGIKIYTSYQKIDLHSDKMQKVVELAEKRNIPLMFHGGNSYSSLRNYGKAAITEIVKASDLESILKNHPDINLILSHLAGSFLDDLILVMKRNNNLYSDMSGLMDSFFEPNDKPDCIEQIKKFLGEIGPKRLLFGTDFPVQSHEDSVDMVEQAMIGYSNFDKMDVYYNNARRLLK